MNPHGSWFCYAEPSESETWAELPRLIERLSPHPTPGLRPSNGQPPVSILMQNIATLSASASSLGEIPKRAVSSVFEWRLGLGEPASHPRGRAHASEAFHDECHFITLLINWPMTEKEHRAPLDSSGFGCGGGMCLGPLHRTRPYALKIMDELPIYASNHQNWLRDSRTLPRCQSHRSSAAWCCAQPTKHQAPGPHAKRGPNLRPHRTRPFRHWR